VTRREQDRELAILRERKRADDAAIAEVLGERTAVLAAVDPADVRSISEYFENLPRLKVEAIYSVDGEIRVDVIPRGCEALERPDVVTYVYAVVERTVRGETSEYVQLREVDE